MVANRKVKPIRLDGVVGSSDHNSNIVCVRVRAVEICVVTDKDWHAETDLCNWEHGLLLERICELGAALSKDSLESGSHFDTCFLTEIHELVKGGLTEDMVIDVVHHGAFT